MNPNVRIRNQKEGYIWLLWAARENAERYNELNLFDNSVLGSIYRAVGEVLIEQYISGSSISCGYYRHE